MNKKEPEKHHLISAKDVPLWKFANNLKANEDELVSSWIGWDILFDY